MLDAFKEAPPALQLLLTDADPVARKFRENIRQYNAAFAFTSTSCTIDQSLLQGTGMYCFRLHGSMYHLAGSLIPNDRDQPRYAQLYIHDPAAALVACETWNPNLDPQIMTALQMTLNEFHPFVPLYKHAYQIMVEKPPEEQANVEARIVLQPSADRCHYNLPSAAEEVAAIIPGTGEENTSKHREIVLCL